MSILLWRKRLDGLFRLRPLKFDRSSDKLEKNSLKLEQNSLKLEQDSLKYAGSRLAHAAGGQLIKEWP
jgi:hypothetical protein